MVTQKNIKKKAIPTLEAVYELIGIRKQHISYWRLNATSTQTKMFFKQKTIAAAALLFELDDHEIESLANKAGLSFCFDENFSVFFGNLISTYSGTKKQLYDIAQISERMFRYSKNGVYLKKETILSLAISMELNLEEIQMLIRKAGFVLSKSLPNDAVIIWLLEHDGRSNKNISYVSYINEVLDSLELPLLMTRKKSDKL